MFGLVGSRCLRPLSRFRLKRKHLFKVPRSKIDKVRTIPKSRKNCQFSSMFSIPLFNMTRFGHNHCSKCRKNVDKVALSKCIRKLITCARMLQFNPYRTGGKQLTRIHSTSACDSTRCRKPQFLSTTDSG